MDKRDYPRGLATALPRLRKGGLLITDNVLWSGRVVEGFAGEDSRPEWTDAIRKHNRLIAEDERYLSAIVPTRDGVMMALRVG